MAKEQDGDRSRVEAELADLKKSAGQFKKLDDLRDGSWFSDLLRSAMRTYAKKVSWEYFEREYPGLPRDAIADRCVDLAKRYAMIEGGITASAYTGALAATIGSGGGASPLTVPAAFTCFTVDLLYLTHLQLRLAYDLSVIYRHPIELDDPEDCYDLLRVAFGIKAGEALRQAVGKVVPEATRQGVKAVAKGTVLAWLKALPVVGKYLLQRNIIKFAIPAVGIPLSMGLNRWTTGKVGTQARSIYRDRLTAKQYAATKVAGTGLPYDLLIGTAWFVSNADGEIAAEEAWLLAALTAEIRSRPGTEDLLAGFGEAVAFDKEGYLVKVRALPKPLKDEVFDFACEVAAVDRELHALEWEALGALASACETEVRKRDIEKRIARAR